MGLAEYRRKRHFDRTPEPSGDAEGGRGKEGFSYVVQKHDASRLHYDFRLELEGVLKSWAVPKGPSLDPKERRLAVEVEDHPLDYGDFEGVIPKGEYGGGTVLLWDRGRWEPVGDPRAGMKKGHLKFRLAGEKLSGGWNLVRLRDETGEKHNWLLIKEDDESARPADRGEVVDELPDSVASGRDLEAIAADRDRVWSSKPAARGAGKAPAAGKAGKGAGARGGEPAWPELVEVQFATLVNAPPAGPGWLHEIKIDGYRMLAAVAGGEARLYTRGGKDWSGRFPSILRALAALPVESALLDGEVAAVGEDGRTSFQVLQNALRDERPERLVYFAFDLLHWNGNDLRKRPLLERKEALSTLLARAGEATLRYSDHIEGQGEKFYLHACRLGIEGVVAKRSDAPYRAGRGRDWVKVKCLARQEFVLGGYTDPKGGRSSLGALLLGVFEEGELRYTGRVGTGFDRETLADLKRRLAPFERSTPAFADPPRGAAARGVHWVEPRLVAEIAFTEWTDDGLLRHPSYQGLREDKAAAEVRRERPAAPPAAPPPLEVRMARNSPPVVAGVTLSNPNRVLFPEQGITKLDLARYYEKVGDWILPHIERRILTLVRCPQGREKQCFYQKHLGEEAPAAVRTVEIKEESGEVEPYPYVEDLTGVVSLVQIGTLELHAWGAKVDKVESPDRVVFDLDPDAELPWERVVEAARRMREVLGDLELESFVQTTGGKGLHVVAPLVRRHTWEEVKPFAKAVAGALVREAPELYLSKASKAARKGKVFLDWLRNGRGATAIVAFSTRARAGAPVAVPLDWEELARTVPAELTVETVPRRLAALKKDPWADFWATKQSIRKASLKAVGVGAR